MPVWFVFGVQSSATDTLSRAGRACDGTAAAVQTATHSTMARIDTFMSYSLRWHYPDQVAGPERSSVSAIDRHPGWRQASRFDVSLLSLASASAGRRVALLDCLALLLRLLVAHERTGC